MRLLLLGTPCLEQNTIQAKLERRKALGLLAYLAVTREVHSRETLATLFWPDYNHTQSLAYLRNTLWTLNQTLGETWATVERDTIRFNPDTIGVDTTDFLRLIPPPDTPYREAPPTLLQAVTLYRGDFMEGFSLRDSPAFDDWQSFQAESWRRQFTDVLEQLINAQIAAGEFSPAIENTRRWLALDPLYEPAHRQLMRLYAWTGQYAPAERHYHEADTLFKQELGVSLEAETIQLHGDIQARRLSPPIQDVPLIRHAERTSSLPPQNTPFVGRAEELTEIKRLLDDETCRLLTVIGPGGIGKTRLALQAGGLMSEAVYFVSLTPMWSAEFIIPAIAAALGHPLYAQSDTKTQLLNHLREKRCLLIMDNFEHLIESAGLLSEILAHAPGVKILVTSRQRLNLREEWLFEVQGLSYPRSPDDPTIQGYSAVQLFVQSARRVKPDFRMAPADIPHIVRICQLVEGMPLAVELAATWMQMLSCQEIAQQIQENLDFLATDIHNVPERHRSIRAVFEQSWEQLSPQEQRCLSRMSIFRGGFQHQAAQAVADASLHLLRTLIGKSLLRRTASGRYEMHELLRQFADAKLSDTDRAATNRQHADYYIRFLEDREGLLKSVQQAEALNAIQGEIDNIGSAWWYVAEQHDVAGLQRAAELLMHFYLVRNRLDEYLGLIQKAVESLSAESADADERLLLARLLAFQASGYARTGRRPLVDGPRSRSLALAVEFMDHPSMALPLVFLGNTLSVPGLVNEQTGRLIQQACARFEASGDRWGMAYALYQLGNFSHEKIQYQDAEQLFKQSLSLFRETGQPWGIGLALNMLAEIAVTLGDYLAAVPLLEACLPLFEQVEDRRRAALVRTGLAWYTSRGENKERLALLDSLTIHQQVGDRRGVAMAYYDLGYLAYCQRQYTEAAQCYTQALAIFREIGDPVGTAWALIFQASVCLDSGDLVMAEKLAREALNVLGEMKFPWGISGALHVLGCIALAAGNLEEARRHLHESVRIADQAQSVAQVLRHLSGVALLMLKEDQPERAIVLAAFISVHPASWRDTLDRAAQILETDAGKLTRKTIEAARRKGERLTLQAVLDSLPDRTDT